MKKRKAVKAVNVVAIDHAGAKFATVCGQDHDLCGLARKFKGELVILTKKFGREPWTLLGFEFPSIKAQARFEAAVTKTRVAA